MIKFHGASRDLSRTPLPPFIPFPIPERSKQPLSPQIHAPHPMPPPPPDKGRTLDAPGASTDLD